MATPNDDRKRAAAIPATGRILAVLALMLVAYVLGRAAGIALDVDPNVPEALAVAAALAAASWAVARRTG